MGRNGKNTAVFPEMIKVINDNIGKVISSDELLLGHVPGRNSVTSYAYKFVKLGYIEIVNNENVSSAAALYKCIKSFPTHYNSVMMGKEMQILASAKEC